MAANYVIKAEVVDINHDAPRSDDMFLVDTNVWYWMAYLRHAEANDPPAHYQTTEYPIYIRKTLRAKARIFRCGLSLAELAHRIEITEWEAYSRSEGVLSTKEFRHNNPGIRANVVGEIQDAWGLVKTMTASHALEVQVDEASTESVLTDLSNWAVDSYDVFLLQAMIRDGISRIITDDGDFTSVPGIRVFTANRNVLTQAKAQSKLVVR